MVGFAVPLRLRVVLSALLLAGSGAASRGDEAVPGAKTEIVTLDVVVTDGRGNPVRDLVREDFELLEDGKPQRLTHFVPAEHAARASGGVAPSQGRPAPDADAATLGRGIVILVDDLHVAPEGLEYVKEALRRFVDEFLAPEDNVAFVTTSGPAAVQQLTRDRAGLKQQINRLSLREAAVAPARGSQITPAQAELILRGDTTALQLAGRTMVTEPGSVLDNSPRAALTNAPEAASALATNPQERQAQKEAERQARGILSEALRFSVVTLRTTEGVLRSLAAFPGRKLCILVSDCFLVGTGTSEERRQDMQQIVDAATRSGAVVYSLDPRGLRPSSSDAQVQGTGGPPGMQASVSRQGELLFRNTLKTLADTTGGFLVQGNDLAGGLQRMLRDNDAYFLMAYEPTNTKRDGRFRKIEVRVSRHADFEVRTRQGYLAPDDRKAAGKPPVPASPPPASRTAPPLGEAEARTLLSAPPPSAGVPFHLSVDYVEIPPEGPHASVHAQVGVEGLHWQTAGGRQQATVDLVGGVYDAGGNPVGAPFGKHAELDMTLADRKRAAETGIQYQERIALPPGRYQVKLLVREPALGAVGGGDQWLDIPDLGTKAFATSSVFLSSQTANAPAAGPGAGEGALRDAQAERRFKRNEGLYFQVYVYNPTVDEKGASDVVLQAQIWSGGKAVAASKPQPARLLRKDGVLAPETNGMSLDGLAAGTYELRVVVVDRKANATLNRRVDFTVE
jgi:VWFA-related protein